MENNEEQVIENKEYKVRRGRVYTIKRLDYTWNDKKIYNYSIGFPKKVKGTTEYFYKHIRFGVGKPVELKNNTKILINAFFEDCRRNPRDKYSDIFDIVVTDFEVVEVPSDENENIIEYQSNVQDNNKQANNYDDFLF